MNMYDVEIQVCDFMIAIQNRIGVPMQMCRYEKRRCGKEGTVITKVKIDTFANPPSRMPYMDVPGVPTCRSLESVVLICNPSFPVFGLVAMPILYIISDFCGLVIIVLHVSA